ncbi:hypothetical protein CBR_g29764 [Chara braunii]|uniref:choline-phosphate cytidylyltransferase n=1 Tax=Chara braunii TaxID=69332 RepID=A0A388LBB4_CHABU|nr:hypothetical protein CBR_g29764 [Chara braunii]|eukprot:GBG79615.1 hypothetical protein CBR_g29764 [Chara braunii]
MSTSEPPVGGVVMMNNLAPNFPPPVASSSSCHSLEDMDDDRDEFQDAMDEDPGGSSDDDGLRDDDERDHHHRQQQRNGNVGGYGISAPPCRATSHHATSHHPSSSFPPPPPPPRATSSNPSASSYGGGGGGGSSSIPPAPSASPSSLSLPDGHDPNRPVRVYADGIYDLFHIGHARSLEQAKKLFPHCHLLVGCCSDALTNRYKGKTVMSEEERYEALRHCKWVDEVVPDAPWVLSPEFLEKHRIDYVAHDAAPYHDASGQGKDVYEWVKSVGKFKETRRTDGISTSDIIMRILKDYNDYVLRNLARGYTRKELGVSFIKEKQLRVNIGMTKLRQKVREQQERMEKKVRERVEKNREYVGRNVRLMTDNVGTVVRTVKHMGTIGLDQRIDWVGNADRWVSGFLEKFEQSCHDVGSFLHERAMKAQLQHRLMRPRLRKPPSRGKEKEEERAGGGGGGGGLERRQGGAVAWETGVMGSSSCDEEEEDDEEEEEDGDVKVVNSRQNIKGKA